jgi:hypothetical protein
MATALMAPSIGARAQEASPAADAPAGEGNLAQVEARLAERYDRLELLVGRLAELSGPTQPRRAALLRQLIAESRQSDVAGRFDKVVAALEQESYSSAIEGQTALEAQLQKLLDLLLQEDRDRQIESERKRIGRYLQDLNRLIRLQRGVKARTDGGDEEQELADDQQRVGDKTRELGDEIEEAESSAAEKARREASESSEGEPSAQGAGDAPSSKEAPSDKPSGEKPSAEEQSSDKPSGDEPKQSESGDAKPSDSGEQPPASEGQPKPGESGNSQPSEAQPSEAQPGEAQPGEGQPSEGQPGAPSPSQGEPSDQPGGQDQQPPGESQASPMQRAAERLRKAQQRMAEAQKRLEEAKREGAVQKQEEAVQELEQAKSELERILRQLREEELERMLVLLEARFRKMLDEQVEVYEQTKKLEAAAASAPAHELEIASGRLSRQEGLIVREADRALVLLREDGTSAAFPEAVEQARDDMQSIAERLSQTKLDLITQGLEEDVIAALEETLAALQQALKDLQQQRGQPQQGGGAPGEKPLVDQLAELRMIRALQVRINRRTRDYGAMIEGEQALRDDLLEALDQLALRQQKIFQATRDLEKDEN